MEVLGVEVVATVVNVGREVVEVTGVVVEVSVAVVVEEEVVDGVVVVEVFEVVEEGVFGVHRVVDSDGVVDVTPLGRGGLRNGF